MSWDMIRVCVACIPLLMVYAINFVRDTPHSKDSRPMFK